MALVNSQTLVDAIQFDGNPNQGRWNFDQYQSLPRTTDIQIDAMSYTEDPPEFGIVRTAIGFGAIRIGTQIGTSRMVWGRAEATMGGNLVNPVSGNAAITFRGFLLPREPGVNGQWWTVVLITIDKDFTGSAQITWHLVARPDTLEGDAT